MGSLRFSVFATKVAWFKSDFCVNCASYIANLLTTVSFCLQKCYQNLADLTEL